MQKDDIVSSADPLTPLYAQIRDAIVKKVRSGDIQPGEKLPSESELQRIFGASRTPVRMALEELETSGLIYRLQGRGSYLRTSNVDGAMRKMTSFGQTLRRAGYRISGRTLELTTQPCTPDLARKMAIEPDVGIIYLRRLLLADEEPIILFNHYLRPVVTIDLLRREHDFSSLHEILMREGVDPWESDQLITATLLSEEEASLLGVSTPFAALEIEQTNYSTNKEVLWYSNFLIRSDRYEYPVILQKR